MTCQGADSQEKMDKMWGRGSNRGNWNVGSVCAGTETSQGRQDRARMVELASQRQPTQTIQGLVGQSENEAFYLKCTLKPVCSGAGGGCGSKAGK